jgi:hypothetical protein
VVFVRALEHTLNCNGNHSGHKKHKREKTDSRIGGGGVENGDGVGSGSGSGK